ncbi:MAG: hypothetical protein WCS70_03135 [Verrucomicrobiota bacterium]
MNFILNIESATYPVEGLRIPPDAARSEELEGRSLFFVSPVRLPVGQSCSVVGDTVGYQLVVSGCFGFAYSLKFLVSGTIAGKLALAGA